MWTPVSLEEIEKMIYGLPSLLSQEQLALWNFIKVTPQKWQEATMGEEGGGFWVVGIAGNKALYYNDIEDGFNLSTYSQHGNLEEYNCSQSDLHEMIVYLSESIRKGHEV
jgi:hypothetical protein